MTQPVSGGPSGGRRRRSALIPWWTQMTNSEFSRRRLARRIAVVAVTAPALFAGGALGLGLVSDRDRAPVSEAAPALGTAFAVSPVGLRTESAGAIERLQQRLRSAPEDATAYAELGAAYVQQARVSGDPAFYPKAQTALDRSLQLRPEDNLPALIGMGALANARHDFAGAARWGMRAVAVSPFNPDAYAVLTDAYTQLGQPARATAAVQRMLDLSPALPALTRASYDLEQRGDRAGARRLMQRALDNAFRPTDVGFCRYYLGELAFTGGDLPEALRQYEAGLVADPQSTALLQGRAKVAALQGDYAAALSTYAELVSRVPNPQYVVEYGELLAKLGRAEEAAAQFALVETLHRLAADNGDRDSLGLAEFEADHGSARQAVRYARAEWERRTSVVVADALAWALHRAGRDREALIYADRAVARGWRNALFFHHRAAIHRALGNEDAAAADAARVKQYNPAFDATLPSFGRPT